MWGSGDGGNTGRRCWAAGGGRPAVTGDGSRRRERERSVEMGGFMGRARKRGREKGWFVVFFFYFVASLIIC